MTPQKHSTRNNYKKCSRIYENERDWLLQHETPIVMNQLYEILTACVDQFSLPCSRYPLTSTSNASQHDVVHGSVLFHEDTICSMEVFVKPSKQAPAVKATFREDKQWKLQQMQDAANYLRQAAEKLIIYSDNNKEHQRVLNPQTVLFLLEDLNTKFMQCQARLMTPCKLSLEALISSGIVKMYSPPLPSDSLVNLFILEDRIVFVYYTVQQTHVNISKSNSRVNEPMLFHPVGTTLEHANTCYEISSCTKAECVIPSLSNVFKAVGMALDLSQELKQKLHVACK